MGSSLAESVLAGKREKLARLLTLVENDSPEGLEALDELFPHTGRAHLMGVTGASGTGKSTLVNQIALQYRRGTSMPPKRVAIVAVDPSSPFSGGALLGDRVRMRDLAGDPGVFIRSMASRGSLGGMARATTSLVQVFDAAGYEAILIETVGAGQTEVDIARLAHTTLVVESPGLGDEIQAIKAGILEIADILVINKADLPEVEATERALKNAIGLAIPPERYLHHPGENLPLPDRQPLHPPAWIPPILRTIALDGSGVAELVTTIQQHAEYLHASGEWQRRERARLEASLRGMLSQTLMARFQTGVPEIAYEKAVERLMLREFSPREAVRSLLDRN
jgi:LAO/AO transport system kinase